MRSICMLSARMGGSRPCLYNCGEHCRMAGLHHKQRGSRAQYLSLPGTSGNYASTVDSVANSITGDIDIRVKVAMTDWTPAAGQVFVAKWTSTGNQLAYRFGIAATGRPNFFYSAAGAVGTQRDATAATGFTDGTEHWVRTTVDVDDGAGNHVVKFYTSEDGETWTQLGSTVTTAGTISLFDSTAVVELGSIVVGTANLLVGKIYRAQIYNGIDGTLAVDFNAEDGVAGSGPLISRFTEETWTINGANAFLN